MTDLGVGAADGWMHDLRNAELPKVLRARRLASCFFGVSFNVLSARAFLWEAVELGFDTVVCAAFEGRAELLAE